MPIRTSRRIRLDFNVSAPSQEYHSNEKLRHPRSIRVPPATDRDQQNALDSPGDNRYPYQDRQFKCQGLDIAPIELLPGCRGWTILELLVAVGVNSSVSNDNHKGHGSAKPNLGVGVPFPIG